MFRRCLRFAGWLMTLAFVAGFAPPVRAQIVTGNFTYQFADTNGNPITSMPFLGIGSTFSFRVYLIQTAGTPTINQLGVQGAGVRLLYDGTVLRVPAATAANITANPAFDLIQRGGAGTGTDTTNSAFLQVALFDPGTPLPFPQDTADSMRMLIGTFRVQGAGNGIPRIQAVDPFAASVNNQTGPNPPTGSSQGSGAINIDPFLAENLPVPVIPTLTVVPEPSAFALGVSAAAGLVILRRRKPLTNLEAIAPGH